MRLVFFSCLMALAVEGLYSKQLEIDVSAESAILMNASTGMILFEKNAHQKNYPASITKIATVTYVLNNTHVSLDERVIAEHDCICSVSEDAKRRSNYTLPSYWLVPGASHIGIKRGEELSVRDLLYGIMLASGDDASNVIASYVAGSVPEFMDQLNAFLVSIGCKETYFNNPHGLYHPSHQTTAYDMALLTRHALRNSLFCTIVSTTHYKRPKTNKQESSILSQSNKLLQKGKFYYSKAIGVKTGYIAAAQNTFVGAARDGDRVLIAVLLKVKERPMMFAEAVRLFEAAFNQKQVTEIVFPSGPQMMTLILEGANKPVKTFTKEDIALDYFPAEEPRYKSILVWDEVVLPIASGQKVGEIHLETPHGDVLKKTTLYAQEDVESTWGYWLSHFF